MNDLKNWTCSKCGEKIDLSNFFNEEIEKIINDNKLALENKLKLDFSEKLQTQIQQYKDERSLADQSKDQELAEKTNQLQGLLTLKAENERLKRTNQEAIAMTKADLEVDFSKKLQQQAKEHQLAIDKQHKQTEELTSKLNNELQKKQQLKIEKAIQQYKDERSLADQSKDQELAEKTNQLQGLLALKAENERLKRTNQEVIAMTKADLEVDFSKKLQQQTEEHQFAIDKQRKQTEELINELQKQQKQQMSQQLQGEMQEEKVEEWLKKRFVEDNINPIKSGTKGADILQEVFLNQEKCGTIYYEIKQTKDWKNEWIGKFKNDIIEKEANFGILVTKALPKNKNKWYLEGNMFVCSFTELDFLAALVRIMIIKLSYNNFVNEDKEGKKSRLYDYVTGDKFLWQLNTMAEFVSNQLNQLEEEKRIITKHWIKRETQIKNFDSNTVGIYGNIKAILKNEIDNIEVLELAHLSDDKNIN